MNKLITPSNFKPKAFDHDFFEAIDLAIIKRLDKCHVHPFPGIWFIVDGPGGEGFRYQWLYDSTNARDSDYNALQQIKHSIERK